MAEQALPYFLFGCYIIELGRFFRGTFYNFKTHDAGEYLTSQVFYGAPREAFKYYMEEFNGMIKLPMINYNISGMERQIKYEKTVYMPAMNDFDPVKGTTSVMRFPSVFEITYSVQMWNNSLRERDYMMHALINSFPMGDAWLIHYPDKVNHPDCWLPMAHKLDLAFTDGTEYDNLAENETRDRIMTSFNIICTRAFVPYQVYEIPIVSQVDFASYINEVNGNKMQDNAFSGLSQSVKATLIDIGLSTVNVVAE